MKRRKFVKYCTAIPVGLAVIPYSANAGATLISTGRVQGDFMKIEAYSETSDTWHKVEKIERHKGYDHDFQKYEVWEDKNADEHWGTYDIRFSDENVTFETFGTGSKRRFYKKMEGLKRHYTEDQMIPIKKMTLKSGNMDPQYFKDCHYEWCVYPGESRSYGDWIKRKGKGY